MSEPLWRSRREAFFYLLPIAVIVAVHVLVAILVDIPEGRLSDVDFALAVVLTALLFYRRRWPMAVLVLTILISLAALVTLQFAPPEWLPEYRVEDPWIPLATPVVAYNAALYRNTVLGWALIASLTVIACRPWEPMNTVITGGLVMIAMPALLGLYVGVHRRLVQALTDRAERAEREQHLLAERARAEERVRLAEEMHDVVTHRVSLMVLHAGALGMTTGDQSTREAAEGLRVAGVQALNELRDLVGVLRNGDTDANAGKENVGEEVDSVPDLSTLVAESTSVGVPVDLICDGNPERTSPTVGRTAYRIVQESLTNIRKHAPGASATVRVRYGGDRVRITVRNTAATSTVDSGLSGTGSGTGLLGLRQRVELVGGTLETGRRPDGGFEVDAILPAYVPAR